MPSFRDALPVAGQCINKLLLQGIQAIKFERFLILILQIYFKQTYYKTDISGNSIALMTIYRHCQFQHGLTGVCFYPI